MRAQLTTLLKQSGVFLDLMIALLGLAALMAALPDYARYMVFPFVVLGWLETGSSTSKTRLYWPARVSRLRT